MRFVIIFLLVTMVACAFASTFSGSPMMPIQSATTAAYQNGGPNTAYGTVRQQQQNSQS